MAAAHGGQVLLSQATRDLVQTDLRDLGEHRLKDLSQRQRIYQLLIEGVHSEFPPPRTLENRPTNLPVLPTPLVGRQRELAELGQLLEGQARLVTLTGPGGTGKSRLALQASAEAVDTFADGVFLVGLAPITDPGLVPSAIAQTLAVREQPGQSIEQTLSQFLSERTLLLLLDNFEQVIDAAPMVAGLLAEAPHVRLLVTSREPLRVPGEQEYPLEPLPVPGPTERLDVERLSEFDSVALLIERALAVRPDFAITNDNAPAVAEICARLDGLPLAIELAAARLRLLSPQALLARLDERLKLLTGGVRGAPERQQTLRATIDWSYRLLSEPEQRLFARLGVFVGGGRIEQVEAVADPDGTLGIDPIDGLQGLVEKSLLRRRDDADGEPRFWMLETIREYAVDALDALDALGDDAARSRRAHAVAYLAFAEAQSARGGPHHTEASDRLEMEQPNLRAALDWSIQAADDDLLARLWIVVGDFWVERGLLREARAYVEPAVAAATDELSFEDRTQVLRPAFWTYLWLGEQDNAEPVAEERIRVARASGDAKLIAGALSSLAAAAGQRGELERALEFQREAVAMCRESADPAMLATTLHNLGSCYADVENWERCRQAQEEALSICRQLGNDVEVALEQRSLGFVLLIMGDVEQASEHLRAALPVLHRNRQLLFLASGVRELGLVALEEGDPERAARLCAAGEAIYRELGHIGRPKEIELVDRLLKPIMDRRKEPAVEAAWLEGETMTVDQAVAYALAGES
jgi:predicted ATPase